MRSSIVTALSLLEVEKKRGRILTPRATVVATVVGVANLLVSSFAEHLLRNDPAMHYLSLFLFGHSTVYFFLAFMYFTGSSREVLSKVRIFPTSPMSRIWFTALGFIRHPFSVALVASNVLSLGVIFHSEARIASLTVLTYFLLTASVVVIACISFLVLEKNHAGNLVFVVLIAFVALGLSNMVTASSHSISASLPVVSLSVDAVQSAQAADYTGAVKSGLTLLMIPILVVLVGKRFA